MKAETTRPPLNRVVIDTNVWLSAALSPRGLPAQLVRRVLAQGVPVFSAATFAELETRIWKPKFDKYIDMGARQGLLHDTNALSVWVDPPESITAQRFCRDVEDDKFIHAAQAASAAWLVTGDQDLLVIDMDLGVRIVTPASALDCEDFCPMIR
jgi:putative PIN family toxin of toxin-antitoxin system